MDLIDGKIIAELERDGRLTVTELAERVSLSIAPCHRRLRELERSGVIAGYRAVVDPAAVGLGLEVLANVTMDRGDADTIVAFEEGLAAVPEVRHAERLFGIPDYLLRVVAASLDDYARVRDEKLATLPGVRQITSTIVMKRIVDNRPLPLSGPTAGRRRSRRALPVGRRCLRLTIWGLSDCHRGADVAIGATLGSEAMTMRYALLRARADRGDPGDSMGT